MNSLFYLLYFIGIFHASFALAQTNLSPTSGISYQLLKKDQHNIHILSVNPKYFNLDILKARNQVIGRETVQSIALRKNAAAAVNASFFEIGGSRDGRPSKTLVINGKIFAIDRRPQGLLVIDQDRVRIIEITAEVSIKTPEEEWLTPNQINYFSRAAGVTLYTDAWGSTTLTPFNTKEIVIDNNFKVLDIYNHGDNAIPVGGFVLSFSPSQDLPWVRKGDNLNISLNFIDEEEKSVSVHRTSSVVTGIPILVKDGKKLDSENLSSFYKSAHARTAIGLKADGTIIIVVVEHAYEQSIKDLTLTQVKNLLSKETNIDFKTLTILKALEILEKRLMNQKIVGLTIPELADLMVSLDCMSAINLDGGGSSTMFIGDKVVNNTIGDQDEASGENIARPVSDAIIVTPKAIEPRS